MTDEERQIWLESRLGHCTASMVSTVMAKGKSGGESKTRASYMGRLITERMTGLVHQGYKSQSMERGNDLEPQAKAVYAFETGYDCVEASEFFNCTGFVKHKKIEWFGASPDLIIPEQKGLAQFKCPDSHTHIEFLLNGKIDREYILQMQTEMEVSGMDWCDFVSFDNRLPLNLQMKIVRVERDDSLIAEIKDEVTKFLGELEEKLTKLEAL